MIDTQCDRCGIWFTANNPKKTGGVVPRFCLSCRSFGLRIRDLGPDVEPTPEEAEEIRERLHRVPYNDPTGSTAVRNVMRERGY